MTQEVKVLIGISLITVIIIVGAVFLLNKSDSKSNNSEVVDQQFLIRDDSYHTATSSARVNIVEFGDYQCPACAQANPTVEKIVKDYQGQVNLVYRHFPLPQHKNAKISAMAAEAAGEQGKFWQMHDKLYATQESWAESNQPLDIFTGYAQEIGLNIDQFQADVTGNKYENKINRDLSDGQSVRLNATPTFFINGQKLESFSYNDFKSKIDSLL